MCCSPWVYILWCLSRVVLLNNLELPTAPHQNDPAIAVVPPMTHAPELDLLLTPHLLTIWKLVNTRPPNMSRPGPSAPRNLTLTEELEKLEQSITLTLQGSNNTVACLG